MGQVEVQHPVVLREPVGGGPQEGPASRRTPDDELGLRVARLQREGPPDEGVRDEVLEPVAFEQELVRGPLLLGVQPVPGEQPGRLGVEAVVGAQPQRHRR